jgi:GrpB-like predicted nucleotidyltransferase (UPF0157 family)
MADERAEPAHPPEEHDPAIRIVEYDSSWPATFEREATTIKRTLGSVAVRIDHVGSTAVPRMPAKPIIDINVSVRDVEAIDAYRQPLEALGYLFVPDPDPDFRDFHFFGKPATRPRSFHIHVCQVDSLHEKRHLVVRDYLRTNANEAREYASIKRSAAEQYPGDRLAYMAAKGPYIDALEQRAITWYESRKENFGNSQRFQ